MTWLSFAESRRPAAPLFDMFAMARIMAAAAAIAVFGAHKFTTLSQQAYQARHLGNYRIKPRLSTGAWASVFGGAPLADSALRHQTYPSRTRRQPTNRMRYEREIQAMARLTHWNTIEIIDCGHAPDGTFYFVMEYVEGLNLREFVERYGLVGPGRVVYLLRQVFAALSEAHACGEKCGLPARRLLQLWG